MKKLLISMVVMLFVGIASAFSQTVNLPITIDGKKYYYDGKQVTSIREMKSILANDALALGEAKKAGVANGFAYVLSFAGGFALGWEIVDIINGRMNPYVLAGGIGFTAAGLGLSYLANSHLKKGVAIYNANLGASSYGGSVHLDFGLAPGGVGLTLSF